MAFPRVLFIGSLGLILVIGGFAVVKKLFMTPPAEKPVALAMPVKKVVAKPPQLKPEVDRIDELFTTGEDKLPIVETVTYASNVPWLKGRPAWIGDYASHYATSRHFIARSLNGKPDYFTQKVAPGSQFNVFKKDRHFQFYLLVDVSQSKMGFYYIDLDTNERVLLKTYAVSLGKSSPLGKYLLGDKIAVYRPGIMGLFQDRQVEMMTVFGTRWIPFGKELGECTVPSKGLGIHGVPWAQDAKTGKWTELPVGQKTSAGSVLLNYEDMEALFSIIITRPTVIEIVKNLQDTQNAKLPGIEVTSPMRGGSKPPFGAKSTLFEQDPNSAQIVYSHSNMPICAECGPAQKSLNLASKARLATTSRR